MNVSTLHYWARRSAVVFLIAALAGATAYLAVINRTAVHSYNQSTLNYDSALFLSTVGVWPRYGTIVSLDPQNNTVTVSLPSKYTAGTSAPPNLFTLGVKADTIIVEQHAEGENGVYTQLSQPIPSTYADLRIGDRIQIIFKANGSGKDARVIVFGNPI